MSAEPAPASSGSLTGIGATIIPSADGGFEIISLAPNGSASKHLQVGDRILMIGAVSLSGKSDAEAKSLILGPAGSAIDMESAIAFAMCATMILCDALSAGCSTTRWWYQLQKTSLCKQKNLFPPQPQTIYSRGSSPRSYRCAHIRPPSPGAADHAPPQHQGVSVINRSLARACILHQVVRGYGTCCGRSHDFKRRLL